MSDHDEVTRLREALARSEAENEELRAQVAALRPEALDAAPLDANEIRRYSRQMLLPEIGLPGQQRLKQAKVLVVGAGGLGCPAILYLAGAGVGQLTIVDHDAVDESNLHRQVLHAEAAVGQNKAHSAAAGVRRLNRHVRCVPVAAALSRHNALALVDAHDVVVDATDNAASRYLLSDACVVAGKPLVSGSALRAEGQLTVYHYRGGPCYRCLFPVPPPPATVGACGDAGVLGVVPGAVGVLQALEVLKVLTGAGEPCSGRLLLWDAWAATWRSVRLRAPQPQCAACGAAPAITRASLPAFDYEAFVGAPACDAPAAADPVPRLPASRRVAVAAYAAEWQGRRPHVLVDVRPPVQFGMCALPGAVNMPMPALEAGDPAVLDQFRALLAKAVAADRAARGDDDAAAAAELPAVVVVCRRGNDSQLAVPLLEAQAPCRALDLAGGLRAWARVFPEFPSY